MNAVVQPNENERVILGMIADRLEDGDVFRSLLHLLHMPTVAQLYDKAPNLAIGNYEWFMVEDNPHRSIQQAVAICRKFSQIGGDDG